MCRTSCSLHELTKMIMAMLMNLSRSSRFRLSIPFGPQGERQGMSAPITAVPTAPAFHAWHDRVQQVGAPRAVAYHIGIFNSEPVL
jgi:hypothetical protein